MTLTRLISIVSKPIVFVERVWLVLPITLLLTGRAVVMSGGEVVTHAVLVMVRCVDKWDMVG